MTEPQTPLDDASFLTAVLDLVIPPSGDGKMPGAGSLGIAPAVAAAVSADSQFGPAIQVGLGAVREAVQERGGFAGLSEADRLALLEAHAVAHPVLMRGLARYVFSVYYQHPRVLAGLGQPPRPPYPEGFQVEATAPDLLAILEARRRA
jgi:hypothetical protein